MAFIHISDDSRAVMQGPLGRYVLEGSCTQDEESSTAGIRNQYIHGVDYTRYRARSFSTYTNAVFMLLHSELSELRSLRSRLRHPNSSPHVSALEELISSAFIPVSSKRHCESYFPIRVRYILQSRDEDANNVYDGTPLTPRS